METITSSRLVLRPFAQRDAADYFEYMQEPVASCFLSLTLTNLKDAEHEVAKRSTDEQSLAVCLRSSGKLIGDLFAEPEGDTFSVGWNFNPAFGGKGYAFEGVAEMFAHLFTGRAARRLYAYVEDTNLRSRRLCERLGMRQEGVFQEFISFRNDENAVPIYENTMQFALLRREWLARGGSARSVPL
ncbi:GNAT family N-acetyltransferase [Achromobacter deleyi]|uniref:GNAT family N-acetyltransferase n=2 Tax=Achromobacter deleyi TaxID=1353891 RepID=A0A7T4B9K4_9BURK|nr:GNAT family N-acetyltransferase [Achromobacter deleyi]